MLYEKDGQIISAEQIKAMYPHISFAVSTYKELGYTEHNPPAVEQNPQDAINYQSRMYLSQTDWYAIRFAETGVPIPVEISSAREAARASIVE